MSAPRRCIYDSSNCKIKDLKDKTVYSVCSQQGGEYLFVRWTWTKNDVYIGRSDYPSFDVDDSSGVQVDPEERPHKVYGHLIGYKLHATNNRGELI